MLVFNPSGLLIPDNIIISDLAELKKEFVEGIPSAKRMDIFNRFLKYNEDLQKVLGFCGFVQWIDGSFVTKKVNPGDIDLVTFIESEKIVKVGNSIDPFRFPKSESIYGVDAYIIEVYPSDGPDYFKTVSDRAYWTDRFSKTRRDRHGNKLKKGFLEIRYSTYER